eukprot:9400950-Pyramimonas_sp.AAC.1
MQAAAGKWPPECASNGAWPEARAHTSEWCEPNLQVDAEKGGAPAKWPIPQVCDRPGRLPPSSRSTGCHRLGLSRCLPARDRTAGAARARRPGRAWRTSRPGEPVYHQQYQVPRPHPLA